VILHKDLKGGTFVRLYPSVKINLNYQAVTVSIGGLWAVLQNVDHSIMISCDIETVHACVIEGRSFVIIFCGGSPEQTGRSRAS